MAKTNSMPQSSSSYDKMNKSSGEVKEEHRSDIAVNRGIDTPSGKKFPVSIHHKKIGPDPQRPFIVYFLSESEDPLRCYLFFMNCNERNVHREVITVCAGCVNAVAREKTEKVADRNERHAHGLHQPRMTNGVFMRPDPSLYHHPNCIPFSYEEMLEDHQLVKYSLAKENIEDEVSTLFPLQMCMSHSAPSRHPTFLYKYTEDDISKCYKFVRNCLKRCANMDFRLNCEGCSLAVSRGEQSAEASLLPKTRKSDGYKLLCDPLTSHLDGCRPYDYDAVIHESPLVTDEVKEKIIRGEDISDHLPPLGLPFSLAPSGEGEQYPVSLHQSVRNPEPKLPVFIYRLIGGQRCYMFSKQYGEGTSAYCSGCNLAKVAERKKRSKEEVMSPKLYHRSPSRKTKGASMDLDPSLHHHPNCVPFDYKEKLLEYPLVKYIVAKKYVEGKDVSAYFPPRGSPFYGDIASESPVASAASKMGRDGPSSQSKPPGDMGTSAALHARKPAGERTKDGKSIYCICRSTSDAGFMIGCENCAEWFHGKCLQLTREFAQNFRYYNCDLCVSKSDWVLEKFVFKRGYLKQLDDLTRKKKSEDEEAAKSFESNASSLRSSASPVVAAIHAESPLSDNGENNEQEHVLDMNAESEEDDQSMDNREEVKEEPQVEMESAVVDEQPDESDIISDDSDGEEEDVDKNQSDDEEGGEGGIIDCFSDRFRVPDSSEDDQDYRLSPSTDDCGRDSLRQENIDPVNKKTEDRGKKRKRRSSIASGDGTEPNISFTTSPPPAPGSVKRVKMIPPKNFKREFDASIFTEDEVDVSVDGRLLKVVFERKSPSYSYLLHKFLLPDYVDISTLSFSFEDRTLTVGAKTTNNS